MTGRASVSARRRGTDRSESSAQATPQSLILHLSVKSLLSRPPPTKPDHSSLTSPYSSFTYAQLLPLHDTDTATTSTSTSNSPQPALSGLPTNPPLITPPPLSQQQQPTLNTTMRSNSISSVESRASSAEPEEAMQIFVKNLSGDSKPSAALTARTRPPTNTAPSIPHHHP